MEGSPTAYIGKYPFSFFLSQYDNKFFKFQHASYMILFPRGQSEMSSNYDLSHENSDNPSGISVPTFLYNEKEVHKQKRSIGLLKAHHVNPPYRHVY